MTKIRVLCVDDHAETCGLITEVLGQYEVISALSTSEGLRRAQSQEFDLILLDYHMSDGNGIELCKQIRKFNSHTPILFVTGSYTMTETQVAAAGAQGIVRKTDIAGLLLSAVHEIFALINRKASVNDVLRLSTVD